MIILIYGVELLNSCILVNLNDLKLFCGIFLNLKDFLYSKLVFLFCVIVFEVCINL